MHSYKSKCVHACVDPRVCVRAAAALSRTGCMRVTLSRCHLRRLSCQVKHLQACVFLFAGLHLWWLHSVVHNQG